MAVAPRAPYTSVRLRLYGIDGGQLLAPGVSPGWGTTMILKCCGLTASAFISNVKEWKTNNPVKTVEIMTCHSRHGAIDSWLNDEGGKEVAWVKSYTDQVKWSIFKYSIGGLRNAPITLA